jgi:hypothetical protein
MQGTGAKQPEGLQEKTISAVVYTNQRGFWKYIFYGLQSFEVDSSSFIKKIVSFTLPPLKIPVGLVAIFNFKNVDDQNVVMD